MAFIREVCQPPPQLDSAPPDLQDLEFAIDSQGNVVAESYEGDGSRLTGIATSPFFGRFGGDGHDGARTVTGTEGVALRNEYTSLVIEQGGRLSIFPDHFVFIAVQGRCTIRGTIDARGRGATGGSSIVHFTGLPGGGADFRAESLPVPGCVSGAGGGGGEAQSINGGFGGGRGGGAEGDGGSFTGGNGVADARRRWGISGGAHGIGQGESFHGAVVRCPGAGGGSGGSFNGDGGGGVPTPGAGGAGGGVVYLECGELELTSTGTVDARGTDGGTALCPSCTDEDDAGGGGGGGGGVVLIRTRVLVDASGQVLVDGGSGGTGAGYTPTSGGAGADGFWDLVVVD